MLRSAVIYFTVIVACLNVRQCVARPTDGNEINHNSSRNRQPGNEYGYKLPSVITDGLVITIQGMISTGDKMFIAVLPSISGGDDCTITYDFATSQLDVTPASDPDHEPVNYSLNLPGGVTETTFSLVLTARTAHGNQMFDLTFEGNREVKNGRSDIIACKIKHFTDIDKIIIKGARQVNSLLFEFPK